MAIRFTVPGEPKGKARPRIFNQDGKTHATNTQGTLNYENLVKWVLTNTQEFNQLTGPIEAYITAYFKMPKSMSKRDRQLVEEDKLFPTKKPDGDNIAKIILDACNSIAYYDDAYVTDTYVFKRYAKSGEEPRVEVVLREIFEKK